MNYKDIPVLEKDDELNNISIFIEVATLPGYFDVLVFYQEIGQIKLARIPLHAWKAIDHSRKTKI